MIASGCQAQCLNSWAKSAHRHLFGYVLMAAKCCNSTKIKVQNAQHSLSLLTQQKVCTYLAFNSQSTSSAVSGQNILYQHELLLDQKTTENTQSPTNLQQKIIDVCVNIIQIHNYDFLLKALISLRKSKTKFRGTFLIIIKGFTWNCFSLTSI